MTGTTNSRAHAVFVEGTKRNVKQKHPHRTKSHGRQLPPVQ